MMTTFQNALCEVGGKSLELSDIDSPWKKYTIDLLDNSISENYSTSQYYDNTNIIIGRQCTKYHFFYNGVATVSRYDLKIKNIMLDKYHFIRIHGPTHFTVNGSFAKSLTSIRITTPDFKTKELVLPFISFDLSSKKKIDTKLRNIQLLG